MNETAFPTDGWRKSSYSGEAGNCVEVAKSQVVVGVRDTKDRAGGSLTLSPDAWAHFTSSNAER